MLHRNLIGQRLLALCLLGWLLFNYPLLALFGGAGDWFGLPAIYAYLFIAWALLIVLMAWVAEQRPDRQRRTAPAQRGHQATVAGGSVSSD